MREIDGQAGERVIASLQEIAPDLGRYVIEYAFGDIYSRDTLDARQRQLVTISSLTTQGGCEAQLHVHINASLNVGLTPAEIVEALMHCSPYTGFPKVLNAIAVAKQVFKERGLLPVQQA
ncbi:carboxymuconolactone decarboxylase family protein [Paenibacillus sp. WLX1005]|uniref:carboxymuconolactone decarboxylase family protein n=1 Tax=unclassified Paenibacillus TaxID=185978 RepID=UPI003983F68B